MTGGGNGRHQASEGGLVRAMFRRQATGKRGGGALGPREILAAKGEFRNRVRRQFEGIPEMIVDARKALSTGKICMR